MQKKLIALAVAGLLSSAAFAQTSVTIGGKFDAGYQFKRTANADAAGGATGGSTTETLGDGSASTSRITVQAKEDINSDLSAMVDLDLRFNANSGSIEEGKGLSQDGNQKVNGNGGLNSNDKKAMYIQSKMLGSLRFGVMNLVNQQFWDFEEKPYMVNVKDLEIVKYGISEKRNTSLTSRNTEYDTPVLTLGPVSNRLKFNYVIGDSHKAGNNNNDSAANKVTNVVTAKDATNNTVTASSIAGGQTGTGDVYAVAETGTFGKWVNWGVSTGHRVSTGYIADQAALVKDGAGNARNGMSFQEHYVNIHPIDGLKIGANFNIYKGYGDANGGGSGAYKEKNTNFVIAYNFGSKAQIGVERSHLNDLGSNRNSGKGWMVGGSYFLSKSTYVYLARAKEDYESNIKGYTGGYDGTKPGFIGSFDKIDNTYTRVGIVKEF